MGLVVKHIQEPVPTLPKRLKKYQPIINRMMAKNKSERIQTEKALKQLLNPFIGIGTSPIPTVPEKKKKASEEPLPNMDKSTDIPLGKRVDAQSGTEVIDNTIYQLTNDNIDKKSRRKFWLRLALPGILLSVVVFMWFLLGGTIGSVNGPYEVLDESAVKELIRKNNFYDKTWNRFGKFSNKFIEKTFRGHKVIVDEATGLMWHNTGSIEAYPFKRTGRFIKNLNKLKYAGFTDWRLPTLKEAATLLTGTKGQLYINHLFSSKQKIIWTANQHKSSEYWVVDFAQGYILPHSGELKNHIRAVRQYQPNPPD